VTLLSVIAPCFNEAGNLDELVRRVRAVFETLAIDAELVLVNDGSHDDTGAIIERLATAHPQVVRGVHHEVNQGIEQGWRSGLQAARGAFACFIDSDLQNRPEDLERLWSAMQESHVDLVQAVRVAQHQRGVRHAQSVALRRLLDALFSLKLRDAKSGFVLARKEVLEELLRHRFRYRYFQTFIGVAARHRRFSIREVETTFEPRRGGTSFLANLPVRVVGRVLADLTKGFVEYRVLPREETQLGGFLQTYRPRRTDEPMAPWRRALLETYFHTMPAHAWMIGRPARTYYRELKRSQWLSPDEVRELQLTKLKRLVAHAWNHVGYYRERMQAAGLRPEDVQSLEDLRRLPFLTKADVREHLPVDLLSDNHDPRRVQRITTSGSTGEPFVCFVDKHQLEQRWAATLRSTEWTGYRFGDRCARLWHQTLGMSKSQVVRERLDALLSRRTFIPAFEMTDERIEALVQQLEREQPVLIDGYAESLNYLAHALKQRAMRGVTPLGVISSAQTLPAQSREIIERSFGSHVFDKYGSREFSGIAWECDAHDGHHVVAESYLVEILRNGRPAAAGEWGEVVITDLENRCMPFIRYRIGDLAVAMDDSKPCACGRGLPRIGRIEGRVQSVIVGTNGVHLPGTFFAHLFKDHDQVVRQYQVIQERLGTIRLRVIRAKTFTTTGFEVILEQLRRRLGNDLRIDVEFVERIEMVRTGKHQGAISTLPIDFQDASRL
jgi:phenylacetate-CoA ligase